MSSISRNLSSKSILLILCSASSLLQGHNIDMKINYAINQQSVATQNALQESKNEQVVVSEQKQPSIVLPMCCTHQKMFYAFCAGCVVGPLTLPLIKKYILSWKNLKNMVSTCYKVCKNKLFSMKNLWMMVA